MLVVEAGGRVVFLVSQCGFQGRRFDRDLPVGRVDLRGQRVAGEVQV